MNRADDKSTELKLDPDLVGHDPELADAVESIRNAVSPGVIKTRAQRSTVTDERARADTIRVVTVRRSNDSEPEMLEVNANRPGQRHVLNVPSGFLTRALPLYWPAPATATEARRRRAIIGVVLLLVLSLGLCVIAYVRSSTQSYPAPRVAIDRQPSVHVNSESPAPTADTRVRPTETAVPIGSESAPSAATTNVQTTAQAPSEPIRHNPGATKGRDNTVSGLTPVAGPQTATQPAAASSSSERKSWFEVR